LFDTQH